MRKRNERRLGVFHRALWEKSQNVEKTVGAVMPASQRTPELHTFRTTEHWRLPCLWAKRESRVWSVVSPSVTCAGCYPLKRSTLFSTLEFNFFLDIWTFFSKCMMKKNLPPLIFVSWGALMLFCSFWCYWSKNIFTFAHHRNQNSSTFLSVLECDSCRLLWAQHLQLPGAEKKVSHSKPREFRDNILQVNNR